MAYLSEAEAAVKMLAFLGEILPDLVADVALFVDVEAALFRLAQGIQKQAHTQNHDQGGEDEALI